MAKVWRQAIYAGLARDATTGKDIRIGAGVLPQTSNATQPLLVWRLHNLLCHSQ